MLNSTVVVDYICLYLMHLKEHLFGIFIFLSQLQSGQIEIQCVKEDITNILLSKEWIKTNCWSKISNLAGLCDTHKSISIISILMILNGIIQYFFHIHKTNDFNIMVCETWVIQNFKSTDISSRYVKYFHPGYGFFGLKSISFPSPSCFFCIFNLFPSLHVQLSLTLTKK